MDTIKLKPVAVTSKILSFLEDRNLIRTLKPTRNVLDSKSQNGAIETVYSSAVEFGSHKLICVKSSSAKIKLNSHPDNEEFIIINNTKEKFKPLYIAIGLYKHAIFEQKVKNSSLKPDDILLLKWRYNDPVISVFTMLKDTPHCEISLPGEGPSPIFFVAEPSKLIMRSIKTDNYNFELCLSGNGRKKT